MSIYIKLFGLALMLLASLSILRGFRRYNAKRLSELEGFLLMIEHLEGRINRYLLPIADALRDFSNAALENIGFLGEIYEGADINSAFEKSSSRLSVGNGAKEMLGKLFSGLGFGYKDDVLKELRETSEKLRTALSNEQGATQKNEQVVSSVTIALVLGVFILLV